MSFSIDTNILLYAYNSNFSKHLKAKKILEERVNTKETWIMPWPIIHSFIRISTHPSINAAPLSVETSLSIIEEFFCLPNLIAVGENDNFFEIYKRELKTLEARGNLVPDVQIASLLKLHGVKTFYSCDRDFRKFDGLKVIDPLG
jgi:toxin-antitoxin system PIN domain toxin